jgi:DNA-binding transcriptional LysR family regulator
MSDIDFIKVRRLDLTMLLVFAETLTHRKLTVVAKQMGLTQSAISHNLGRLRDVFGDPLFLRRPQGVEPTARALELEPKVRAILALAGDTLKPITTFDPSSERRSFRIGALDYHGVVFGPGLCRMFEKESSASTLIMRAVARGEALDALNGAG